MILLQNGQWKHSATEEGIRVPGAVKITLLMALLVISFLLTGCDQEPLQPDTTITDLWEQVIRSGDRIPVTAMVFSQTGELLVARHEAGIQIFRENADGYELVNEVTLADNRITELFADSTTGFLYAGTFGGTLFRSTDFGNNWRDITPAFDDELLEEGLLNWCAGIAASPDYELFAAFSGHGVFYSTDFGTSWTSILGPPRIHGITAMGLTPEQIMYVGTLEEGIFQGGTLAGVPFWTVTTGITPQVTSILAFESGAFIGTDEGRVRSWLAEEGLGEATGGSPLPGSVLDMILSPGGMLYIAVENNGVWRIGEGTSGNVEFNIALFDRHVRTMTVDPGGYLLVGTETEGIFRSVFPVQFYDAKEAEG